MRIRSRVRPRKDKAIFKRTAVRTHVKNLPGHNLTRGGICL